MASTQELEAWVKQAISGLADEGIIIPVIREVVNILCKVEAARFLMIDPSTGRPYLLTTAAGSYGPYNGPVGAWRVSNLLLKEPANDYGMDIYENFTEKPFTNTTEPIEINGNWYYPYNFCKADDALEGARVQIHFSRDPGTTTDRFYTQAYRTPTQITSNRIPLPIPDSYGCHRLYVLPACLALIKANDHGNYADALTYIEGTIKPEMWKVLNKGAQGRQRRVTMRPY